MKLALLIFLALSTWVRADEVLTWERIVEEAREKNPDLEASRHSVDKSKGQRNAAISPFLPQISANAGMTYGSDERVGVVSNTRQYSAGVAAKQNVFNGFQDAAKLSQANAVVDSSEWALRALRAKLHGDLKTAFATALFQKETLVLLRKVEERRRNNAELVALRFEGGRENKGAAMRTQAQFTQASFEVGQADRNLQVARRQLSRLLGRDDAANFDVAGSLMTKPLVAKPDFRELAKQVPTRQQSEADMRAAQAATKKAKGEFLPTLDLSAAYSRVRIEDPPDTYRFQAGVTLSLPVFNGALNIFNVQTARAEELRAEAAFRSTELQIAFLLEQSFANLENAVARAVAQEANTRAAELRSEIGRGQYEAGVLDYNQWDIIENERITQQQNLIAVRRDALTAEGAWEQATGKGDLQ